ncbi:hypothetical protein BDW59DRAFT_140437 [Aspergillus cavernicola]|uniref:Protein YAE1 n=1 Tax=Aspergillus cavernicola TaxID=176166 RepID=A0ABR4IU66_9EURO
MILITSFKTPQFPWIRFTINNFNSDPDCSPTHLTHFHDLFFRAALTMSAPDTSLDDIFGSSPPDHTQTQPRSLAIEPSELPSLRRQHVTAGYRDGISASKAEHVQHGFDSGFPVGAQLGMRAGTILGILEGVLRGYEGSPTSAVVKRPNQKTPSTATGNISDKKGAEEVKRAKREQILIAYRQAVRELNVQAVFAGVGGNQHKGEEKPEDQLLQKGDAVLAGWESRVCVAAWEENAMDVLEARSDDGHDADADAEKKEGVVDSTAGQS